MICAAKRAAMGAINALDFSESNDGSTDSLHTD